MTITVHDTATGQQLTVREVSAALALPEQQVSAPYSRAVGILDAWVRDSRRAVDEFAAWIEGQTAQAKAEMRQLCDELGLPIVWAVADPVPPVFAAIRARYGPIGGRSPFDTSPAPDEAMPGRAVLAPTRNPLAEAYAEREARGWTPDPADYDTWVALDPTPEGSYVRVGRGVDWRAEWAELVDDLGRPMRALRAWWRAKQAQRDERMGVEQ
ncbi:MAG TPA: hypothetical protein VFR23_19405 [Jiangellaceae bacterium]|nr:hypothetical protein [Jiangellaceae bacterium]